MDRDLLSEEALAAAAKEIPEWRVEDGRLTRSITSPTFPDAIELVRRIADAAEDLNHHPDIDIRWRTLHLTLSTHDRGGITAYDTELAKRIDALI
jgi:4a-hydroxytetrahydrobiopterin dehydratase